MSYEVFFSSLNIKHKEWLGHYQTARMAPANQAMQLMNVLAGMESSNVLKALSNQIVLFVCVENSNSTK